MIRAVSLLLVSAALMLTACDSGNLSPDREINPAVHKARAADPQRHVPAAPRVDENGWPINR
jgi:hypothetical protein